MTASSVFGDFLKEELARQDARKASFEQRGIAVVTTAGTLVTLVLGLAALTTTTTAHIGHEEKIWVGVAIVLFLVAAALALSTNFPGGYKSVDIPGFLPILNKTPEHLEADAEHAVAEQRALVVATAQRKTSFKGSLLFGALVVELAALICFGVASFEVVKDTATTTKYVVTNHHPPHKQGLD